MALKTGKCFKHMILSKTMNLSEILSHSQQSKLNTELHVKALRFHF